jgi:lysozyme
MAQPSAGSAPTRAPVTTKAGALIACGFSAAAALLCTTVIPLVESGGKPRLVAYHGAADPPGVWTVCDGITGPDVRKGLVETHEGCQLRLDKRLAQEFGPAVLTKAPALRGHDYALAAATVFAFNVGVKGWNGSTAARRFAAGDIAGGCAALGPYFTIKDANGRTVTTSGFIKANGKVVPGLVNRRTAERTLCLTGSLK